jgi:hypothetical protein
MAMEDRKKYIPKMNDSVLLKGLPIPHVVLLVRPGKRTADVRTSTGPVILYYDVPWSKLSLLKGSQAFPEDRRA